MTKSADLVDSFRKNVQRYRDRIRRDHSQTATQQAKAEECARVSVARDKNMHLMLAKFDTMHGTGVSTPATDSPQTSVIQPPHTPAMRHAPKREPDDQLLDN